VRVVYLNPSGKMGGAETSLRQVLASVREAQPEWELFLVLGEDGPLAAVAGALGVHVIVQPFPPAMRRLGDAGGTRSLATASMATAKYTFGLSRLLRGLRPDIVHTNGLKMHLLGAWTRPARCKMVWHIHDYVGARRSSRRLLGLFRRRSSGAIANSRSVAVDLHRVFPGLRVVSIYNAIDLQRFSPSGTRLDLDAKAGLQPAEPGTVRVGLVATFAKWKGHNIFLEALAGLSSRVPVRGYILGGPIYQTDGSQWSEQELHQEADRLGLTGKVGFTGFLEDTPAAMRSLDIIVHASTEPEPFGMVIIEGMACGKAVIASQAGGAAELFVDGENALAHRPGDAAELARQIERLAEDAPLREALGRAGRLTAERLFHGRRLAAELLEFYREVRGDPAEPQPETVAQPRSGESQSRFEMVSK
jgi:glycosyltransferase involved in cell wall biosynthesis